MKLRNKEKNHRQPYILSMFMIFLLGCIHICLGLPGAHGPWIRHTLNIDSPLTLIFISQEFSICLLLPCLVLNYKYSLQNKVWSFPLHWKHTSVVVLGPFSIVLNQNNKYPWTMFLNRWKHFLFILSHLVVTYLSKGLCQWALIIFNYLFFNLV
jgi:hypothetical protein